MKRNKSFDSEPGKIKGANSDPLDDLSDKELQRQLSSMSYSDRDMNSPNEVFLRPPPQAELEKALGFPLGEKELEEFLTKKKKEREEAAVSSADLKADRVATPDRYAEKMLRAMQELPPSPKHVGIGSSQDGQIEGTQVEQAEPAPAPRPEAEHPVEEMVAVPPTSAPGPVIEVPSSPADACFKYSGRAKASSWIESIEW